MNDGSAPNTAPSAAPARAGRFAPSPTGPLHLGSLVAALASRLDALAHGGRWLVRIEDLDHERCSDEATGSILHTLDALGFAHDGPVVVQSTRNAEYQAAFDHLLGAGSVYPCACSRREIADSLANADEGDRAVAAGVYPGTCRAGLAPGRAARAWRVRVGDTVIRWRDRCRGERIESLAAEAGDFIIRRADGYWAYQLAVVVDDHLQGITDVVRGDDLLGSTARQIHLLQLLGWPIPRYLHLPVVRGPDGHKLSKQTGARAVDDNDPVGELNRALVHLGFDAIVARDPAAWWPQAVDAWQGELPALRNPCARRAAPPVAAADDGSRR